MARCSVENGFELRYATWIVASTVVSLEEWWRGFFYFLCFFAMHVFLWRNGTVRKSFGTLLVILIIVPSLIYAAFFTLELVARDWLSAWLLHVVLAANYIAAYPAIAAQSPTIQILNVLRKHPEGIAWPVLLQSCPLETAVGDRIDELVIARLIVPADGDYTLTRRGYVLARGFQLFRTFLGLPEGDG
ncbi:MAG: hypothetical protein KDD51_06900 [Bdellovibrionales bacterium]|nr:hypothetical protein [Bdellovibrionales bacterium]